MTECTISCFHNCYYTDINNSRRPTINFLLSQLYIIMKCSFQSWIPIYIYMMLTYQEIFHRIYDTNGKQGVVSVSWNHN